MFKDTLAYLVLPLFLLLSAYIKVGVRVQEELTVTQHWISVTEKEEQICAVHPSFVPQCCGITKLTLSKLSKRALSIVYIRYVLQLNGLELEEPSTSSFSFTEFDGNLTKLKNARRGW